MNVSIPLIKSAVGAKPLRFITAAARFDGHDAAIHILRRLLQERGCEVIHLGHNRSVSELVRAAVQEDVDALAISSYQGGHIGFFSFLLQQLNDANVGHIQVFCGGGGTITPEEAEQLEALGITRVYSAGHHDSNGLQAIADEVITLCRQHRHPQKYQTAPHLTEPSLARQLSMIERDEPIVDNKASKSCPVIGITGTGGAGKSTLLDTLLARFLKTFPEHRYAVLAIDPTRRRSGGALLGDRICINSLTNPQVFFRSMATRRPDAATCSTLKNAITLLRNSGFDLVFVETAGIGQGNAEIKELVDISLYVMTPEYGGPGQLEKIEMLDWADLVVLNKADRPSSEDALLQIKKQWSYNHQITPAADNEAPVFPCTANSGAGYGCDKLFVALCEKLSKQSQIGWTVTAQHSSGAPASHPMPPSRRHYLGEIAQHGHQLQKAHKLRIDAASRAFQLFGSLQSLDDEKLPDALMPYPENVSTETTDESLYQLRQHYNQALAALARDDIRQLRNWSQLQADIQRL